jgi:hypothetical protein
VICGTQHNGLYLFLDYYINTKISEGYSIRKKIISDSTQLSFENYGVLSLGYSLINSIMFRNDKDNIMWIIDVQRQFTIGELNRMRDFGDDHPNFKVLFIESLK